MEEWTYHILDSTGLWEPLDGNPQHIQHPCSRPGHSSLGSAGTRGNTALEVCVVQNLPHKLGNHIGCQCRLAGTRGNTALEVCVVRNLSYKMGYRIGCQCSSLGWAGTAHSTRLLEFEAGNQVDRSVVQDRAPVCNLGRWCIITPLP